MNVIKVSEAVERVEEAIAAAASAAGIADLDAGLESLSREALICGQTVKTQEALLSCCGAEAQPPVQPLAPALRALVRGIVAFNQMRLTEAEKVLAEARDEARRVSESDTQAFAVLRATLQGWSTSVAIARGRPESARACLDDADALLDRIKMDTLTAAWIALLRAQHLVENGPIPDVDRLLADAERIFGQYECQRGQAEASYLRLRLALDRGDDSAVRECLEHFAAMDPVANDHRGVMRKAMFNARFLMAGVRLPEARKLLEKARGRLKDINLPRLRFDFFRLHALLDLQGETPAEAVNDVRECAAALPDGENTLAGEKVKLLDLGVRFHSNRKSPEVLAGLGDECERFAPSSARVAAEKTLLAARIRAAAGDEATAISRFEHAEGKLASLGMLRLQIEAICERAHAMHQQRQQPSGSRPTVADIAQVFHRAMTLAGTRQTLQQLVSRRIGEWMTSINPTEACQIIASLENRREELEALRETAVTPLANMIDMLAAREQGIWLAIAHEVFRPVTPQERIDRIAEFYKDGWPSVRGRVPRVEPGRSHLERIGIAQLDFQLVSLTVGDLPSKPVHILSNSEWLIQALALLTELLERLDQPTRRKPVLRIQLLNDQQVQLCLESPGMHVNENQMRRLMEAKDGARPAEVHLSFQDWPKILMANAFIHAVGGELRFESTPRDGQALNRFLVEFKTLAASQ